MQRVAFTMRVKAGQEEEYVRRHKEVWPAVLEACKRAGVHKSSIFMNGRELFVYMEVEDYAEAVRILGEDPESVRWEEYMEPIVEAGTGDAYDPANAYPAGLPEVWYWEAE
jgi:L-rhamnose mutarotase